MTKQIFSKCCFFKIWKRTLDYNLMIFHMCLNCVMNIDVDICMIGRDWPSRVAQSSGSALQQLAGTLSF